MTILRENGTSVLARCMWVLYPDRIEIWRCWFCLWRKENWKPREEKVGSKCSHHCVNPAADSLLRNGEVTIRNHLEYKRSLVKNFFKIVSFYCPCLGIAASCSNSKLLSCVIILQGKNKAIILPQ